MLYLHHELAVLPQTCAMYQASDGLSNDYDAGIYLIHGVLQLSLVVNVPLCVLDHKQNYRPINGNREDNV